MIEPVISPLSALARNATCAGDLVGLEQAAERPALLGSLQPAVLGAVIGLHDAVFARRVHPADGQPVDADAVVHDAVGDVPGERDQRALRSAVGGDEALTAMAGHRDDVDDRAFDLLAFHHLQSMLHQEERRPHIDREHGVEQRRLGIPDRAAIGQTGRIDEYVDAAECLVGSGNDLFGILGDGKVGRHEDRLGALCSSAALTFSPRAALRPVTTRPAAPRSANRRAMASPSPCVEPVTIATLPSSESDFSG